MKNLNLLSAQFSDRVSPVLKNEIEFWKIYLTLLNTRTDNWITRKEIKVMSWVLANDPNMCYFSKPGSDIITEEVENLSSPELTRVKKKLIGLGLVEESLLDGKIKTMPVKAIASLKRYMSKTGEINFVFPIKINEETQISG
jgi:hypothetical protein